MSTAFSVYIATSLDGFIARDDGAIDWLELVHAPGEDYGYARFFGSLDAIVVGRATYDVASGFDPFPYTGKRCVVMTRRPLAPRAGVETFAGDPRELAVRLARDGSERVYVDGGDVIRQFLAAGLVTDLTLSVVPVLLGSGRRLFGGQGALGRSGDGGDGGETPRARLGDTRLDLVECRGFPSGLAQLVYRVPAGENRATLA